MPFSPTAHVYCTLQDSTLTSELDVPAGTHTLPAPAPLPQTRESWNTGSHTTANSILSYSCQGLLLFPGLLGRASIVVADRHPPPRLHSTGSPPLVSLLCTQLMAEQPAPMRHLLSPHQEKWVHPLEDATEHHYQTRARIHF